MSSKASNLLRVVLFLAVLVCTTTHAKTFDVMSSKDAVMKAGDFMSNSTKILVEAAFEAANMAMLEVENVTAETISASQATTKSAIAVEMLKLTFANIVAAVKDAASAEGNQEAVVKDGKYEPKSTKELLQAAVDAADSAMAAAEEATQTAHTVGILKITLANIAEAVKAVVDAGGYEGDVRALANTPALPRIIEWIAITP